MVWYGMGDVGKRPTLEVLYCCPEKYHLHSLYRCPHALPPALMEWVSRTSYSIAHRGIANTRFVQNHDVATNCISAYFHADNGRYIQSKNTVSCNFFIFFLFSDLLFSIFW